MLTLMRTQWKKRTENSSERLWAENFHKSKAPVTDYIPLGGHPKIGVGPGKFSIILYRSGIVHSIKSHVNNNIKVLEVKLKYQHRGFCKQSVKPLTWELIKES